MTIWLACSLLLTLLPGSPLPALPLPTRIDDPTPAISKPALPEVTRALRDSPLEASRPQQYDRAAIARMVNGQRQVLLTFDDGPNPRTTPQVLDVLRRFNVKAVFFLLGMNVKKHPELAQRIAQEGHVIGNHSYHHPYLTKFSAERIRQEIAGTNELIERTTGVRPTLFRPPYGAINRPVIDVLQSEGMSVMLWNLDPSDWRYRNSSRSVGILARQMKLSSSGKGGIVVMHDTLPSTVPMLESLLELFHQHNFTVASFRTFGNDKRRFWSVREPIVLQASFPRKLHPETLGKNHLLTALITTSPKKPLSSVHLLQAKKMGTLRQTLLCQGI